MNLYFLCGDYLLHIHFSLLEIVWPNILRGVFFFFLIVVEENDYLKRKIRNVEKNVSNMIERSIDKVSFSHDGVGDAMSFCSYGNSRKEFHIPVQETIETIHTLPTHRQLQSITDRKHTSSKMFSLCLVCSTCL